MNEYNDMVSGHIYISSAMLDIDAYDFGIFSAGNLSIDASIVDVKTSTGFDILVNAGGLEITNSDVMLYNNCVHTNDYEETCNIGVVTGYVYIDSSTFDFDGADIGIYQDISGMNIQHSTGSIRSMVYGINTCGELNLHNSYLTIATDYVAVFCYNGSIYMESPMNILSPANGRIIEMTTDGSTDTWETFATYRGTPCMGVIVGPGFADVSPDAFYYDATLWAVEQGITTGTGNGTFSPGNPCDRAQVVTFLWRALGEQEPSNLTNTFTDVAPGSYYYNAVLFARDTGITTGTSATTFSPSKICTRAEIVTFIWRACGSPAPYHTDCDFTDVDPDSYYYDAMLWAVENGITNGTGGTNFSPDKTCTRAEVMTFLYRQLGLVE